MKGDRRKGQEEESSERSLHLNCPMLRNILSKDREKDRVFFKQEIYEEGIKKGKEG
jgi:hypothetical protein